MFRRITLFLLLLGCLSSGSQAGSKSPADSLEVQLILAEDSKRPALLLEIAKAYLEEDPAMALKKAGEALQKSRKLKDRGMEAEALRQMSDINRTVLSDHERALQYALDALKIEEELIRPHMQARTLICIAETYLGVGSYYKSLESLLKANLLAEANDLGGEQARIALLKGQIFLEIDNRPKALSAYRLALETARQEGELLLEGEALFGLGRVNIKERQYGVALTFLRQAQHAFATRNRTDREAEVLLTLGRHANELKTLQSSEALLTESNKLFAKNENVRGQAKTYNLIGLLALKQDSHRLALDYLHKGLDYAEKSNDKNVIRESFEALYETYASLGNYKKALQYKDLLIAISEFIYSEESDRKMAEMQSRYEIKRKEDEIEMLRKDTEIGHLEIDRQKTQKNFLVLISLTMLLVVALSLFLYLSKKRTNKILKARNKEIETKNDQLEQLNATKDKFFSIISHDLKGPLNSLSSFSSLLINHTDSLTKEEIQMLATDLDKSVENLYSLLENLLEWARTQTDNIDVKPEKMDITAILHDNVQLLCNQASNKNIRVKVEAKEGIQVFADRNTTNTIIRNLLSNAIKFTHQGGQIKLSAVHKNNEVAITVSDNGVGMTEEAVKKIFRIDQKHTTNGTANEKGTGLGLMLVKEFIEKNGGKLHIKSKEGAGSSIRFTLPYVSSQELVVV
ncbi:ATP-binding protein [Roseivirga sp. BDSF3-8]|uniref:ATP-binding protein n=1 Tax=Roseivirga sp. BDSF3-8 TaxID=3241598 RepID=UPI00353197FF